jgi:hypothetical protein
MPSMLFATDCLGNLSESVATLAFPGGKQPTAATNCAAQAQNPNRSSGLPAQPFPTLCRLVEIGLRAKEWYVKLFLLAAALILSTSVYAQDASKPPTGGGKSAARMKPKAVGCTLVGTVRGTKLWAGDCTAPDQLRASLPSAESNAPSLQDQAAGAVPADQK